MILIPVDIFSHYLFHAVSQLMKMYHPSCRKLLPSLLKPPRVNQRKQSE